MIKRLKPQSEFGRNVLTLMTGTTIAQAIPVAISPILTRMYSPEDFGLLALFVAVTSIFGSVANGRYELAIMLPKKDEDAINIFALGFIITTSLSLILLALVVLFNDYFTKFLNNDDISLWLYFVPLTVFFSGIYNILSYFNNRKKQYKDLATSIIIKSIVTAIIQLSIGFLKGGVVGLISGQIVSQFFANTTLLLNIIRDKLLVSKISKVKIVALAKRYKDFPKYTMWAALANTSSLHLTNILIGSFYGGATIGYYFLVQKVLSMPTTLIGRSISGVFFQHATKIKNSNQNVMELFVVTLKKLVIISALFYIPLYFFIEDMFVFVFGSDWIQAAVYAQLILPLLMVQFIVSPLTKINHIYLKNKNSMLWQFGLMFLYIVILLVAHNLGIEFESILVLFSIIITAYYLFHLYLLYFYIKRYGVVSTPPYSEK